MWLKTYLTVTGIGAFLALAFPWLVIMGMFMLVIPGLILGMMPTAFLYGLVFAAIRFLLSTVLSGAPLNIAAAVATLAVFWVIPQPAKLAANAELEALRLEQVLPSSPVKLAGNILVQRPFESRCDDLCAALLKTPGVTSVTLHSKRGEPVTYVIADETAEGEAGKSIGYGLLEPGGYNARDPLAGRRALEAEWNLMLTQGGKMLMKTKAAPTPDFIISIVDGPAGGGERIGALVGKWSLQPSGPTEKSLEISSDRGEVLLRQELLSISTPSAPLLVGTSGGLEDFHVRWERQRIGTGERYADIPVTQLLLDHTSIARGVDMAAAERRARDELAAALNDPARPDSDPAFSLANQWMESHRASDGPLSDEDRVLLAQVIADPRVTRSDGLWAAVGRLEGDAADLRRLAALRYLAAEDKTAARGWVNAFGSLPAGAYSVIVPEEQRILSSVEDSLKATGLIRRQGDRGVEAVPDLLRMLRAFATHDPGKRGYSDITEATHGVRKAFRIIGPDASFAREEIETILAMESMQRRYRVIAKSDWDELLYVLGRPLDTIEKPENLSGTVKTYRERIVQRTSKPFDPTRN
ncbi:MAG: EF-hand domain-containing protein [Erythrobacter sp.]|nr:EF-hand domain-containing protein [Erythrobacter sp.]